MDCADRCVRDSVDSKRPKYLQVPAANAFNEAMREKGFVRSDSASVMATEQIALIHTDAAGSKTPNSVGAGSQ
jgi:hypothetical protein